MRRFVAQIAVGALGLWLAIKFVPDVALTGSGLKKIQYLLLAGLILALINSWIKPILNFITWPLKLLTFGLFSLIINMAIIWLIDILLVPLIIVGLIPLFWTTLIIWSLNLALHFVSRS